MKAKPWQLVVIVVGLVVGLGALAYNLMTTVSVDLENTVHLMDVETGQMYQFSLTSSSGIMLPARRPDTKKIALVRVIKDEGGGWRMSERDLAQLKQLDADVKVVAVDAAGNVKPTGSVSTYTPPKLP